MDSNHRIYSPIHRIWLISLAIRLTFTNYFIFDDLQVSIIVDFRFIDDMLYRLGNKKSDRGIPQ